MTFTTYGGVEWEQNYDTKTLTFRAASSPQGGCASGEMWYVGSEHPRPWDMSTIQGQTGWDLVIEEGVTKIGGQAFRNHYGFTKTLILPSTLTYIDSYAFAECRFVGKIIIPKKVTKVGYCAFYNVYTVSTLIFKDNVRPDFGDYLNDMAFWFNGSDAKVVRTYKVYGSWVTSSIFFDRSYLRWEIHNEDPPSDKALKIKIGDAWKDATPYVFVGGTWKKTTPYVRVGDAWK